MDGELRDSVLAFQPLSLGRESIRLGRIPVGEIGPVNDPRSLYAVCFRIDLPFASSSAWMPAHNLDDARRQAIERINEWITLSC